MEMLNTTQTINVPTQFHSLVYKELELMPQREVYIIWEMIRAMKQSHNKMESHYKKRKFNFERSQILLKNIKGSLSDDIINIEREDRV